MPNSDQRVAALAQGEINMMHTSTASDMATNLPNLRDEGTINLMISGERTEVAYLMLNATKPPFDTKRGRLAVAQAIDRKTLNEKANAGFATIADGPFAPDVMGHLDHPGFPGFDPAAAKAAVAAMKADGEPTAIQLLTSSPPVNVRLGELESYDARAGLLDRERIAALSLEAEAAAAVGAARRANSALTKKNNLFFMIGPPSLTPYCLSLNCVDLIRLTGSLPMVFSFLKK